MNDSDEQWQCIDAVCLDFDNEETICSIMQTTIKSTAAHTKVNESLGEPRGGDLLM